MPRWVSSIPARLTAAAVALGCTASSRAEPMVDINSAVAAAGQQTRAVIARLNDLHASHAGGAPNGGIRTERLRLELDEKQVPLRAFSRFMPSLLKDERTGPVGSFVSGSARLAQKAGRHQNGETYLETPGLTAGADMQVGQHSSIGVAGGYIATAEKLSGRSLAVYGAHTLKPGLTFDAIAGTGDLSFSSAQGADGGSDRGNLLFGGFGMRKETSFGNGLKLAALTRFNYASANAEMSHALSEMVTGTVGVQASYRIDYLWGTLTPRAGIEHIQEMADSVVQPTVTSVRFGLTALHRDGGILTIDHSTTQALVHTFRAALKMKF
jgi:Autotransporter beta-domain